MWNFDNTRDVKAAMTESGSHWWDDATIRFFATQIPNGGKVYGGRVFVASHKPPHGPRRYGVHIVENAGNGMLGIENAEPILDCSTTLRESVKVAKWIAGHALPDTFTYDQGNILGEAVKLFRAGRRTDANDRIGDLF